MAKLKRAKQPMSLLDTWPRSPRRFSLLNLLCLFLVCTVLLTAYMHGLIEVDSNRLVINIASSAAESARNVPPPRLRDSDKSGDESSLSGVIGGAAPRVGGEAARKNNNNKPGDVAERHGRYDLQKINMHKQQDNRLNNNNNMESPNPQLKKNDLRNKDNHVDAQDVTTRKTTTKKKSEDKLDKNLTNFFLIVERNRAMILSTLPSDQISELLQLRNEMLIDANLKRDADEDSDDDPETAHLDRPAPAATQKKNKGGVTDDNKSQQQQQPPPDETSQAQFPPITRELLVRFLKLEKFRLQKLKKVRKVAQLLEEFIEQSDLSKDELPPIWNEYFVYINELGLYNNSRVVDKLLKRVSTAPVTNCYEKEKGTQIKLLLNLDDGTEVLVKPMKVPRDYETPPDHFYFVDFERHHAEIAAFHVDRLLGFNRVPPTVGRVFNMTTELWEKADEDLGKTFFFSPAGNVCFTGHCSYYCDTTHAICGRPHDRMEGSVQIMLPSKPIVKWQVFSHPYRRTYMKRKKALWEVDDTYCEVKLLKDINYSTKLILDIMDMAVFDFITGNMDRHHYEKMISLGNETFMLHLDNGRSFGKIYSDEMSVLAPLRQCCLMRYSTYERLKYLYLNKFSTLLDASLRFDPLYPVLTDGHYKAVDRRLSHIIYQLIECTRRYKPHEVIIDDGY